MTIDALSAGLTIRRSSYRSATARPAATPPASRTAGASSLDALLALGPQGVNHRGLRLPLVGWLPRPCGRAGGDGDRRRRARRRSLERPGAWLPRPPRRGPHDRRAEARRDPRRRPARHAEALRGAPRRRSPRTSGTSSTRSPAARSRRTSSPRCPLRAPLLPAAVLLPCDLREMTMLGDAGSNVLGGLLGLSSVGRLTERRQMDCDRRPRLPQPPR